MNNRKTVPKLSLRALVCALPVLSFCVSAQAGCGPQAFADPGKVRLATDEVMIVTHATAAHDARMATKTGLDEAVRHAKDRGIGVVYLKDGGPDSLYLMADCHPDHWIYSEGGEVAFEVPASHVYVAGGHLEMCLSFTLHEVLQQWARQKKRNLTVTYVMDAIYSNAKEIDTADPFFADMHHFLSVVSYGRPSGESWPKLTLLETMGVIKRIDRQLAYLERILPHHSRTLPDYRVELVLNNEFVRTVRPAIGKSPPVLRFHFIDSAFNLSGHRSTAVDG